MPVFLQGISDPDILSKNRILSLDVLRNLSGQSDLALQETCVLAWGQIARYVDPKVYTERADLFPRVSNGDEMNLMILKLVEYLGHTNALLCGLAYDEVSLDLVPKSWAMLMISRFRASLITRRFRQ